MDLHSSVEFRIYLELFYINSVEISLKIPINQGLQPDLSSVSNRIPNSNPYQSGLFKMHFGAEFDVWQK